MLPLYERIEALCSERNLNITQMCKLTGVPRSALSDYKTGRKKSISLQNIEKIADYFEISVDRLLGKEEQKEKEPDLTDEDRRDIARILDGMVNQLGNHNVALMFDGEPVDEETKELMKISLENQFRLAKKLMQKRKSED